MLHESDVEGALILQDRVQVLVDDEADVVDVAAPDGVHELPEVLGVRFDIQTRLSLQIWKDGSLNSFQLSDYLTFFLSTTFSLSPRQATLLTRPDGGQSTKDSCSTGRAILHLVKAFEFHNSVLALD